MPFAPMPVQQHAFEQICTYLMSYVVSKHTGHKVRYQILGGRGQPQWGLDVVTNHPIFAAFVGQCKHKQPGSKLSFSEVLQELKKSDGYERPIERFYFLTNSERDSQLQTKLIGYEHTRPNRTTFPVELVYWADLHDLSFIPKNELHLLFPEQAYHARHFLPPKNMEAVAAAYDIAPLVMNNWFSQADIEAIIRSPHSLKIPANLSHKMNLFQQAVDSAKLFHLGLSSNGSKPCVRQLFRALPAIDAFAHILHGFKKKFDDLEGFDPHRPDLLNRCSALQYEAEAVVNSYRLLINGDTSWDEELASLKHPSEMY